jgi:hypothetical protein
MHILSYYDSMFAALSFTSSIIPPPALYMDVDLCDTKSGILTDVFINSIGLLTLYGKILARVWTVEDRACEYILSHRYVSVKYGRYINCIIIVHLVIIYERCSVGDWPVRDHFRITRTYLKT